MAHRVEKGIKRGGKWVELKLKAASKVFVQAVDRKFDCPP
jgi:hypothetical protein